ncbi:Oxygen-dependent choline dehydrogenase [Cytospora mali]|uniref:Oxygen-dependent choline dehydrogenase n=1 Tax=Cytospora mali TaxID=578113 RepID=A0A194W731_CYTMA|nr:Oxygen-dependent choline dehydrogenase [Valsa mali]
MEFGRRLLPQVVDYHAQMHPSRIYASMSRSPTDLTKGFRDVTMVKLAAVVNRLSWWLEGILGVGNLDAIAYIGPADIRYAAMFLAAVKCRHKMLFVSMRNQVAQNQSMIVQSQCRVLFYAEEMTGTAEAIRDSRLPELVINPVPSLDELLSTDEETELYPYTKTFDEAQAEPCLILHSSGSTGDPKLVTLTHGAFACTDNDRNVPVPKGRSPQNATQFNFEGGGKFFSCFPPYHLAGVHAYITLPIFSTSSTVVFGPANLPPNGHLLSEILQLQHVRALYVPPLLVEQWAAEPPAAEQAKQLDFILWSGGPLSPNIGQELSKSTNVCQMYGSLEMGQVQLLVPQTGEWSYLELNPFEEADMQPCGDGTFEMVLHQHPKFAAHRSLWHTFPDVKEWRTRDLFVPHPSKPGLWRFHARLDDLIVLSSGYKLRPLEMETLIQGNNLLNGALIVGQGKPEPLLIVEPKPGAYCDSGDPQGFVDRIWPTVEEVNQMVPSYAKISRSRVLVADPERPFIRAPKGSVIRKLTARAFLEEIEAAYVDEDSCHGESSGVDAVDTISSFILPGLKQFVRKHVERHLRYISLSDTDDIFLSGLDSIGATSLSRSLQNAFPGLATRAHPASSSTRGMALRLVYANPTIERLASAILGFMINRDFSGYSIGSNTEDMERTVQGLTQDLPLEQSRAYGTAQHASMGLLNVALIGPRGSLGPNIIQALMSDSRIAKIYCLSRGDDGEERTRAILRDRKVLCNSDERLSFMPIDLGKPCLGLSPPHLDEILNRTNLIIHNAWHVDFNWTLDSYKETYLRSVRELVNLSSMSPLRPRIVFLSSVSSVQQWAAVFPHPVAEAPLETYEVTSPLGYGQSKHVAERILARASNVCGTPVTIIRLGQIAGPTDLGNGGEGWSMDEWIPSLAAISKTLRMIPVDLPPIDWVPMDMASRAIVELAVAEGEDKLPLKVFNVVNPHSSTWSIFAETLQERLDESKGHGQGCCQQVTLAEWVSAISHADLGTMSVSEARLSTKILPFFQHLVETAARGVPLQPGFSTDMAARNYIIIGGGTSGLVVANRLSENPDVQVLVLETGKDLSADPRVNVPALFTALLGSDAAWQYESVPQPGLGGRVIREPQGKALGGSSAINGQAFIAPAQADIDAWAKLGNPGWDWAGLKPSYKKSYTLIPPSDQATLDHLGVDWIDNEEHGTSGPIKVSFPGIIQNPLCKAWIDAFRSLNKVTTADPFSGNSVGGYSNMSTVDPETKTRSYAGSAYGAPLRQRSNVRVLTEAKTEKILFTETGAGAVKATGVQVLIDGKLETFTPKREVILAAGTFNTPKLLELSGIGNRKLLEELGVPVVVDLPGVGENLQDHLMTGVSYEVVDGIVTGDPLMRQEPEALAQAQKLYTEHKTGPFAIGGIQSYAFMPTPDATGLLDQLPGPERPEDQEQYEIVRAILDDPSGSSGAWFMFLAQANLHEGGKSFVGTRFLPGNFTSLGCFQSHPFSRGTTHISSADVDAMPNIDPRYFSHPADLELLARHVQALDTKLRATASLSSFLKPDGQRNHPDAFNISDLEGAKKYVLDTATAAYHSCGTAAMLPKDKGGVVDSKLVVYRTENLRVVDASIFPLIPRGNILSSVYAVAEKAADIIKGH